MEPLFAGDESHGFVFVDSQGRIIFANPKAHEFLGLKDGQLSGKPCESALAVFPQVNQPLCCSLQKSDDTSGSLRGVYQFDTENDNLCCRSRLVTDSFGFPLGIIHVLTLKPPRCCDQFPESTRSISNIVGEHPAMQRLYEVIELVAKSDVAVHICGESGVGKELVADAIHKLSERSRQRFVKLNCSTIPRELLESSLFGHTKGAFTGAIRDTKGYVEAAEGGTIFLDEVADISPEFQLKLLRLLQFKEYQRVGDTLTHKANIRIISATNQDLATLLRAGKIREDFYYRINVFPITVPALRERRSDIPLLCKHFIELLNRRYGKNLIGISPDAEQMLMDYNWPGNVRELENLLEHTVVLTENGLIAQDKFPDHFLNRAAEIEAPSSSPEFERIKQALYRTHNNRTAASKLLGISRVTLWKKLKQYGFTQSAAIKS